MTRNVCGCPSPPGGRAICEGHQLAICRIKAGSVETECASVPSGLGSTAAAQWTLAQLTGLHPHLGETGSAEQRQVIQRAANSSERMGRLSDRAGSKVTFTLPEALAQ